jgi:hypothetical protein
MSLNAATIEILIAKGLSASDILDVARATEVKKDPTNAERQARHRAKRKAGSNAVTVTPNGSPNEYISIPPSDSPVISNEMTSPAVLKVEHVVEAWNATASEIGLRTIRKLTPERQRKVATRIRQNTIEDFTEAIGAIGRSPFLRGENDRGWRANFDWMLEPKNFTKLIEGTYDR